MQGLGKRQLEDSQKTDVKILEYIKNNPYSHVNKIIRETKVNPNSTQNSLKRLYDSKMIIKANESDLFTDMYYPKNRICFVFNNKKQEAKMKSIHDSIPKSYQRGMKKLKPKILQLANVTAKLLGSDYTETVENMRNVLGIHNINESMIGRFLFAKLKNDVDYPYDFYKSILPDKYTKLVFRNFETFIEYYKIHKPKMSELSDDFKSKFKNELSEWSQ